MRAQLEIDDMPLLIVSERQPTPETVFQTVKTEASGVSGSSNVPKEVLVFI